MGEPFEVPLGFAPVTPARRKLVTRVVSDGLRVGLATCFGDGVNDLMRELGTTWSAPRRMWVCAGTAMREVLAGLERSAGQLPDHDLSGVRDEAAAAWRTPSKDFFAEVLDVQLLPIESGGFALTSAIDPLVVSTAKRLGGRFHRHARAWEIRRTGQEIMAALREHAGVDSVFVFQHEAPVLLENLVSAPSSEVPISVPGAASPVKTGTAGEADPAGAGFLSAMGTALEHLQVDDAMLARVAQACGLRDYQQAGVRFLIARSSALLADDMGLGKTRQAVVAGRIAAGESVVLVACPASLAINWEREIHAVYPDARVALVGQHDLATQRQAQWIIANYERLGGLVRETELRIGCMLVDEAHYLKEHQAGRTRNAFLLAQRIPRRFLLTGTPVLSREIEVHTLLRLSGHPLGHLPLVEFRKSFAGDDGRRAQLAERLGDWMLRRGKNVLKDLGDKTHQVRVLQASDGLAGYRRIMADTSLMAMPKITKLRQHLEALKLDFLVESVQSLPGDAKAIIFCEYMDTVETLRQALHDAGIGCVSLVGSDAPKKRMAAVDAFQKDASVKVFIGTTMAAGVGITLTAANYVFFASLPWTPALKRQAEDRAYRSGQTRDVFVIIPVVAGTIDEQIVALLDAKREIEVSIVEAVRTELRAAA